MLAADTGEVDDSTPVVAAAYDEDWSGFLVSDLNGHVMIADVLDSGETGLLSYSSIPLYDLAISPTGQVYGIGESSAGTSILYQVEVDFDDPGGYVIPDQIGWVWTNTTGVRLNGLEFTADGTLLATGYDYPGYAAGNYLYELDVETANADYLVNMGSYESAGDVTSDEDGNVFVPCFSGDLISISSDYSGYTAVGNLGYSDVYGMTYGPGPVLRGYRSNGDVLLIDQNDASWELEVSLWSELSSFSTVLGASALYDAPTNLGEVDYVELTDQEPILEQLWYCFETAHDGLVTFELEDAGSPDLTLYREDSEGNLEEVDSGSTRVDSETVAGERFYVQISDLRFDPTVRVVNLVDPGTDTLTVYGTDENDDLVLAIGSPYEVEIHGVDYELDFDSAAFVTTTFDGEAGSDSIQVIGGDGDDAAQIDIDSLSGWATGDDFQVDFSSTTVMEFDGGDGHDTAEILGTDADSDIYLEPFQAELVETVIHGAALNTEEITIEAAGGQDDVVFQGNSKNEYLELYPTWGVYHESVPEGEVRDPAFTITANDIESNDASSGGGYDTVSMRDSAGDETFWAGLSEVSYEGPGYVHEIHGFRSVHAYGMNGGNDEATIFDTPDDDKFKGREELALLRGWGFYFRAKGFETVEATALYGGDDLAVFYDTAGDDLFTASYETASMTGSGLVRTANGFTEVLARSTAGYDIAQLEDSPGRDEFRGRSHKSIFRSRDDAAMDITVRAFDEVYAEAVNGGADIAKMHDTSGDDYLYGSGDTAQMSAVDGATLDLLYQVTGFETVKAYWSTGTNTKDLVAPIDFVYQEVLI